MAETTTRPKTFTPALENGVAYRLQHSLVELIDLDLQARQAHWNVVGPNVRSLRDQFDEISDLARLQADALAERLARVARRLDAARMLVWSAAWMADEGIPNAKEASMAKASAGQAAIHACIESIQICGAHGALAEEHAFLEKWFRDIKVFDIFEGTGQIQRIVISRELLKSTERQLTPATR